MVTKQAIRYQNQWTSDNVDSDAEGNDGILSEKVSWPASARVLLGLWILVVVLEDLLVVVVLLGLAVVLG